MLSVVVFIANVFFADETATSEAVMEAIESTQWSYVRAGDGKFYRCYGCVNVVE